MGIGGDGRDDSRVSRKLVAGVNGFLLHEGLNLGDQVQRIHTSIRDFVWRAWLNTRERDLKVHPVHSAVCLFLLAHEHLLCWCQESLVWYMQLQLQLRGVEAEDLLGLLGKELDQSGIASITLLRCTCPPPTRHLAQGQW